MSDGLPTDRQLAELEERVLQRIRRRSAIRGRVVTGVAAVALVVGGVVLVHPTVGSVTGASSGSAGSAARGASSAEVAIRCHATNAADSTVRTVPLPARPTPASVAAACAEKAPASGSGSVPTGRRPLPVACRTANGVWEVFPGDGHPSTLCARNGLRAG